MRPRTRAAGIVAGLGVVVLTLTAAIPNGGPTARFVAGTVPGETGAPDAGGAKTTAVSQTQPKPPLGALPAEQAIRELRAGGAKGKAPAMHLDGNRTVRTVTAAAGAGLGANADKFVQRYAAAFGLNDAHTIARVQTTALSGGFQVQRYQQLAGGLPILGGEVVVTTDARGVVRSAITDTTPLKPTGSAQVTAAKARETALQAVNTKYGIAPESVGGSEAKLWLYNPALIGGAGKAELRPTYWVSVTGDQGQELASVLVDAVDGQVRLVASEHQTALRRRVCDMENKATNLNVRANYVCTFVSPLGTKPNTRVEGGAPSPSIADINKAYDYLGAAYQYYKNNFGRDSYNGRGVELRTTVRACHVSCPFNNAFWDGYQFVFGTGWATDDVVAHEYTHAVTENASNLYYWYQSGAINEALSDIFGEFIDLANAGDGTDDTNKRWQIGENLAIGAIRDMRTPSTRGQPERVDDSTWDPDYDLTDNGGVHTNSGPANKAAFLIADGGNFQGYSIPGIGLAKSAQLWYRVMHVLPSGANYEELGLTLNAVCREFIGHLGFTVADCTDTVARATTATYMHFTPGGNGVGQTEAYVCLGNGTYGEPPVDLFYDDMERPSTKWTASNNYYWQQLPNPVISYSYAAHGRGSINGWTTAGGAGNGTYIEMAQPVTLPAGKPSYVHFAHSMIKDSTTMGVDIFIWSDGTWKPLIANYDGSQIVDNHLAYATQGFGSTRIDLAAYQGKSVKIRFKINSAQNKFVDWYLDDFRVFHCDNRTGAPGQAYGYHTAGGAALTWSYPSFVSRIQDGSINRPMTYNWELTYDPPIPGAPATVEPNLLTAPYFNELLLAQADPTVTYRVTMAARTEDGRLGTPLTVTISPNAPLTCPANRPIPSTWLSGLKPRVLPPGQCYPSTTPRRP